MRPSVYIRTYVLKNPHKKMHVTEIYDGIKSEGNHVTVKQIENWCSAQYNNPVSIDGVLKRPAKGVYEYDPEGDKPVNPDDLRIFEEVRQLHAGRILIQCADDGQLYVARKLNLDA